MKQPAVIFDRDGTLASVRHHQDENGDIRDWHDFHGLLVFDAVVPQVAALLRSIRPGVTRIMTTGRVDDTRRDMLTWIRKNDLPIDILLMRRSRDNRRDCVVKQEIYERSIAPFFNVHAVIDDRPSVCDTWRDMGLHVIQVVDPGILPTLLQGE